MSTKARTLRLGKRQVSWSSRDDHSYRFNLEKKRIAIKVLKLMAGVIRDKTALGKISSEQSDPFRVLISTILSARTKDPITEAASTRLFREYPGSRQLSRADPKRVSVLIYPVAFYNVKGKKIIEVAKIIEERYGGEVPSSFEQLIAFPSVGRKTANCVLVYGFKIPAIPVDTHVHRISNRIGLVNTKTPEETEKVLSKIYPRKYWLDVNELFVSYGQTICKPARPKCSECPINKMCNYYRSRPR